MRHNRQELLAGLRALADESSYGKADRLLLDYIDDQEATDAYTALTRWCVCECDWTDGTTHCQECRKERRGVEAVMPASLGVFTWNDAIAELANLGGLVIMFFSDGSVELHGGEEIQPLCLFQDPKQAVEYLQGVAKLGAGAPPRENNL